MFHCSKPLLSLHWDHSHSLVAHHSQCILVYFSTALLVCSIFQQLHMCSSWCTKSCTALALLHSLNRDMRRDPCNSRFQIYCSSMGSELHAEDLRDWFTIIMREIMHACRLLYIYGVSTFTLYRHSAKCMQSEFHLVCAKRACEFYWLSLRLPEL